MGKGEGRLALRVLEASRNQLFFAHRFLEQALFRLKWKAVRGITFGSDGEYFYYDERYVLRQYMQDPGQVVRGYLHTVMHCLYQHPFLAPSRRVYWDLAADIAAESLSEEILQDEQEQEAQQQRREVIKTLEAELGAMSAKKISHYLENHFLGKGRICGMGFSELCSLFRQDEHAMWYSEEPGTGRKEETEREERRTGREKQGTEREEIEEEQGAEDQEGAGEDREETGGDEKERKEANRKETEEGREKKKTGRGKTEAGREETEAGSEETETGRGGTETGRERAEAVKLGQVWKHTAQQVMVELQAVSKSAKGDQAGTVIRSLGAVTRENYDYSVFLQKFALRREERMGTDQDEFDYIFYTYGLNLFRKVPLIEPLEYKEVQVIREFVIAIDTSGSCAGELVERFLVKTCNILRQTETFALKVNIHIIQCDAEVQEDVKIESQGQLEEYISHLELKGFGGTDFRPVFKYVDNLLETGELGRVEGLLYFTDGYGSFPVRPPWYRTAFVFLDRAEDVKVPPWAMKVYLEETEL